MTAKSFKGEGQVRVVLLQEEKELYLAVASEFPGQPFSHPGGTSEGTDGGAG